MHNFNKLRLNTRFDIGLRKLLLMWSSNWNGGVSITYNFSKSCPNTRLDIGSSERLEDNAEGPSAYMSDVVVLMV
ncbi:unnamed protein product [Cercopithifilaria johnstoni]|uniref:Uncharacterized protein n=1 Tax=Cercopithifilaria johnstoni TaxID=2874296 RepID=A0A8J2MD41_9BILA|nr:unnamed protein product [Cercopithifilaria johnstoni]